MFVAVFLSFFLPFFLFLLFWNIAIFVTSVYLYNSFIVLCHASITSKTDLAKCALCCWWIYSIFPFFKKYPQPLKLRGAFHRGFKRLPRRSISLIISCVNIWTHLIFSKEKISCSPYLLMEITCWTISIPGYLNSSSFIPKDFFFYQYWFNYGDNMLNHFNPGLFELIFFYPKSKNILRSWFIDGDNILNHITIPRNQQNVTCFCYIWWWIRLLLDNCLMILAWTHHLYNRDCYCFFCIKPW